MKEKEFIFLIISHFCAAWGIFIVLLSLQGETNMEWWQTLIAGAVTLICSIITAVVTLAVARRSKIDTLTKELSKLSRQLGLNDDKTLRTDVSDKFNSIIANIGRENGSTLTQQHSDLKKMLEKEITTSEKRYSDEEKRIKRFTYEQHNIYETVKQFELFLESWKRLAADSNEQEFEIIKLKEQNADLQSENQNLTAVIQELRNKPSETETEQSCEENSETEDDYEPEL